MRVAITGASGFLGGNLAVILADAGNEVSCTYRSARPPAHLDGKSLHWVRADLGDRQALHQAFLGRDVVYHCAASLVLAGSVNDRLRAGNVDGTRNVVAAVRGSGAGRLVHCSSIMTCAVSEDGRPVDEAQPWNLDRYGLANGYVLTKKAAEATVLDAVEAGLDAVIVNPAVMFGPLDARPSSGQLILDVINRRLPGFTTGIQNFADVRDVCRGMIAAASSGKRGQRYILGGHNKSYRDVIYCISKLAGVKPPRHRLPRLLGAVAGYAGDLRERISDRPQMVNSAGIRWAYASGALYSSARAERELGYQISPLEPAISDAIDWFLARGMLTVRTDA